MNQYIEEVFSSESYDLSNCDSHKHLRMSIFAGNADKFDAATAMATAIIATELTEHRSIMWNVMVALASRTPNSRDLLHIPSVRTIDPDKITTDELAAIFLAQAAVNGVGELKYRKECNTVSLEQQDVSDSAIHLFVAKHYPVLLLMAQSAFSGADELNSWYPEWRKQCVTIKALIPDKKEQQVAFVGWMSARAPSTTLAPPADMSSY